MNRIDHSHEQDKPQDADESQSQQRAKEDEGELVTRSQREKTSPIPSSPRLSKRPGMIYAAICRLDLLMAIGESRRAAKVEARARGEHSFSWSTGRIHSYQTRTSYQQHVLHFLNWVRLNFNIRHLEDVDVRVDELASAYLTHRIESGASAWTLASVRSSLRLFFSDRSLCKGVTLPPRRREQIRRSRMSVAQDHQIQVAHYEPLIAFLSVCGLRRAEVSRLRIGDIVQQEDGRVLIEVRRGKGGKSRCVPVVPGGEEAVLSALTGRGDKPEERVFERLPSHLDIHHYRRLYAQSLYRSLTGYDPPPPRAGEQIRKEAYDLLAVREVSQALGHHRLDVVLTHYLS